MDHEFTHKTPNSSKHRFGKGARSRIIATLAVLLLAALLFFPHHGLLTSSSVLSGSNVQITASVKNSKPDKGPFKYTVKKGSVVHFTVNADKVGAIGVPTNPPQKIVFTKSPVIFSLTASSTGDFQFTYQPQGAQGAVLIGTLHVTQ
jgi:hypothetical protein